MSSIDSSLLAGASYLTRNLYQPISQRLRSSHRPLEDEEEDELSKSSSVTAFRISTLFLGAVSVLLSLSTSTIYGLWVFAGDLGYVMVFPQFAAAVFLRDRVNGAGSAAAAAAGAALRLCVGEPTVALPALIETPKFGDGSEVLPVKTMLMLACFAVLMGVSWLADRFKNRRGNNDVI